MKKLCLVGLLLVILAGCATAPVIPDWTSKELGEAFSAYASNPSPKNLMRLEAAIRAAQIMAEGNPYPATMIMMPMGNGWYWGEVYR